MARVETADVQATLDALRSNGAAERNPARFAYLEALARRIATQPEAVRRKLAEKFNAMARDFATPVADPIAEAPKECAVSPLSELLTYINQRAYEQGETLFSAVNTDARRTPELRSIACFQETWSRLSTEQQLAETLACAPENAGPLNSQHLVLRSLQLMHNIAPDYLQGFMSYIDTLIWLEQISSAKPATGRLSGVERETAGLKRSSSRRKPVR